MQDIEIPKWHCYGCNQDIPSRLGELPSQCTKCGARKRNCVNCGFVYVGSKLCPRCSEKQNQRRAAAVQAETERKAEQARCRAAEIKIRERDAIKNQDPILTMLSTMQKDIEGIKKTLEAKA